jgi:hypothetical protein
MIYSCRVSHCSGSGDLTRSDPALTCVATI